MAENVYLKTLQEKAEGKTMEFKIVREETEPIPMNVKFIDDTKGKDKEMDRTESMKLCFDDFMARMELTTNEEERTIAGIDFMAEWLESGNEITPTIRGMFAQTLRECSEFLAEKTLV